MSMQAASMVRLSMPCWLEHHGVAIRTPARKAVYHADCPNPIWCPCPAHDTDRVRAAKPAR